MLLNRLVRKLGCRQQAHGLEGQVPEVRLAMTQELSQLVARSDQQVWLAATGHDMTSCHFYELQKQCRSLQHAPVIVDDQRDRLEEDTVLCVRMLHLF